MGVREATKKPLTGAVRGFFVLWAILGSNQYAGPIRDRWNLAEDTA